MKSEDVQAVAQKLTEELTDQGKIIEGGWIGFRMIVLPQDASPDQLAEMRKAFFAGAAHLFASVLAVLDDDREPTERDLKRMTQIHLEVEAFNRDFEREHLPARGK